MTRTASPEEGSTIRAEDCEALYGKAATLVLRATAGRLRRIEAEFTVPPSYREMVADGLVRWGQAAERRDATDAFAESRIRWRIDTPAGAMTVVFTEVQGVVRAEYALP